MGQTSQRIYAFLVFIVMAFINYFWISALIPTTETATDGIVKYILQASLIINGMVNIFLVPLLISAGRNIQPEDIIEGLIYTILGIAMVFMLHYAIWPVAELMLPPNTTGWYFMVFCIIILTFVCTFVWPNHKALAEM